MNFLSHHAVACRVALDEPGLFYAGNLAPDWLGMSGEGTLKERQVAGKRGALAEGVRLHLRTDHRFHTDPVFTSLCTDAGALLRAPAWDTPLRRVFFYAHVAVELAMDHFLLRRDPTLAEDLFQRLSACLPQIAPETAQLLEAPALPVLAGLVERFVHARWILTYATDEGLAARLGELGQRIGHAPLTDADRCRLAAVFAALRERVDPETEGLIQRSISPFPLS